MAGKRDLKTNQFQDKTLASAVIGVPRVAVVEMDGGRFLARGCGSGPGSHEASWKEDKIACLVTMEATCLTATPTPSYPRVLGTERRLRNWCGGWPRRDAG